MRVVAAWTGKGYIDWRGIAFDQSHGSHASLVGDKVFENPVGPGIANPQNGNFKDPRFLGKTANLTDRFQKNGHNIKERSYTVEELS